MLMKYLYYAKRTGRVDEAKKVVESLHREIRVAITVHEVDHYQVNNPYLELSGVGSVGVVLTEQQQQILIDNANIPEIAAIRKYLDACLSGQVLEDHQFKGGLLYPCYPEDGVNSPKGFTIL